MKHTPTPWQYYEDDATLGYILFKPHVGAIGEVYGTTDDIPAAPTEGKANVEIIIKAVNVYNELCKQRDDLLAACEAFVSLAEKNFADWESEIIALEEARLAVLPAIAAARDTH